MRRPAAPLWLAQPSRFATLSRGTATWSAVALAVLIAAAFLAVGLGPPQHGAHDIGNVTDLALYETIIDGLRAGGHYYQLAADTMRAGSYPLRPFVTMRLPVHAVVQAWLPLPASMVALWLLTLGVAFAWWIRLAPALPRLPSRIAAAILLAGGLVTFIQVDLIALHEVWAAQLVALSMALRRPGRWIAAVALALIAMLVRETAVLYAVVMAGLAFVEGHRREAFGWAAALGIFALVLGAHAHGVASVTGPLDATMPGWTGMLGFGASVASLAASTALAALPLALAAPLVALALFGWAAWRDPLGLRAAATFAGYATATALFARTDAFNWALLSAPVLLIGLAFAPDGIRDIARTLLDRRRVRVQRVSQ